MLKTSAPKARALIGSLAVSGMRIMELLSRRWTDLEVRPEGYAVVRLSAEETKGRRRRLSFLTSEVVEWLSAVRTSNPFLFPGEDHGHVWYASAQFQVKQAFLKVGLLDRLGERYTIHSFRTFADADMRACGLDGKYVSAIVGHQNRLQAEAYYLDWNSIEREWSEKCSKRMCFLADYESRDKADKLERRNGKLELLLEKLLERL